MTINDFFNLLKARKSIRSFISEKHIPLETEKLILEAGRLAPSAGNVQTWHFFVIKNQRKKQVLVKAAYGQNFIAQAPLVVLVAIDKNKAFSSYGERGLHLYAVQDTAAAIENMLLAAKVMDIGSCWVGAFDRHVLERELEIDAQIYRVIAIIPFGYNDSHPPDQGRISLTKVVTYL